MQKIKAQKQQGPKLQNKFPPLQTKWLTKSNLWTTSPSGPARFLDCLLSIGERRLERVLKKLPLFFSGVKQLWGELSLLLIWLLDTQSCFVLPELSPTFRRMLQQLMSLFKKCRLTTNTSGGLLSLGLRHTHRTSGHESRPSICHCECWSTCRVQ